MPDTTVIKKTLERNGKMSSSYDTVIDQPAFALSLSLVFCVVEKLFPEMPTDDQTALWKSKEEVYRLISTKMTPLPGLLAFLDRCRSRGLAMILVTNAPRLDAVHTLEVLNLSDRYGGRVGYVAH